VRRLECRVSAAARSSRRSPQISQIFADSVEGTRENFRIFEGRRRSLSPSTVVHKPWQQSLLQQLSGASPAKPAKRESHRCDGPTHRTAPVRAARAPPRARDRSSHRQRGHPNVAAPVRSLRALVRRCGGAGTIVKRDRHRIGFLSRGAAWKNFFMRSCPRHPECGLVPTTS
jgi:hypothetical protein